MVSWEATIRVTLCNFLFFYSLQDTFENLLTSMFIYMNLNFIKYYDCR
jgi:hypothetical protein